MPVSEAMPSNFASLLTIDTFPGIQEALRFLFFFFFCRGWEMQLRAPGFVLKMGRKSPLT